MVTDAFAARGGGVDVLRPSVRSPAGAELSGDSVRHRRRRVVRARERGPEPRPRAAAPSGEGSPRGSLGGGGAARDGDLDRDAAACAVAPSFSVATRTSAAPGFGTVRGAPIGRNSSGRPPASQPRKALGLGSSVDDDAVAHRLLSWLLSSSAVFKPPRGSRGAARRARGAP